MVTPARFELSIAGLRGQPPRPIRGRGQIAYISWNGGCMLTVVVPGGIEPAVCGLKGRQLYHLSMGP